MLGTGFQGCKESEPDLGQVVDGQLDGRSFRSVGALEFEKDECEAVVTPGFVERLLLGVVEVAGLRVDHRRGKRCQPGVDHEKKLN